MLPMNGEYAGCVPRRVEVSGEAVRPEVLDPACELDAVALTVAAPPWGSEDAIARLICTISAECVQCEVEKAYRILDQL